MRYSRPVLLLCLLPACTEKPEPAGGGIQLPPIAAIGGQKDTLSEMPRISTRLSGGDFYATTFNVSGALPRHYSSDGKLVGLIGRTGAGPGEYRWPGHLHVSHDTVFVFDITTKRVTLLHEDSVIRTFTAPVSPFDIVELHDGSLVASNGSSGNSTALTHMSREGAVVLRFGDSTSFNDLGARFVALDPDGSFWSAERHTCLFRHWSAPGDLVGERTFCDNWTEEGNAPRPINPDNPPPNALYGFWVDSVGVWVVSQTADPQWSTALKSPHPCEGGQTCYDIDDYDRAFDTRIDVYDPGTGLRVTECRLGWGLVNVTEPGVIAHLYETDEGLPAAELYAVRLGRTGESNPD